jgi:hypothetical protein
LYEFSELFAIEKLEIMHGRPFALLLSRFFPLLAPIIERVSKIFIDVVIALALARRQVDQ